MSNSYTGAGGNPAFVSDETGRFSAWSVGGLQIAGFAGGTTEPGLAFLGYAKASATAPAISFNGWKPNSSDRTALTGTDKVLMVQAGLDATWATGIITALANGNVGIGTVSPAKTFEVSGDISLKTAGNGIYIKEGTNATMGTATLSSGTVTISTTKVTANSRIYFNLQNCTNCGVQYVSARTAGTSFTITSLNGSDASTISWLIVEPN
ncbi:unnamed protein product [Rotaria sp. Silwood2]|nr:unnamed protein product [Rotaria sp. Silwood2]